MCVFFRTEIAGFAGSHNTSQKEHRQPAVVPFMSVSHTVALTRIRAEPRKIALNVWRIHTILLRVSFLERAIFLNRKKVSDSLEYTQIAVRQSVGGSYGLGREIPHSLIIFFPALTI